MAVRPSKSCHTWGLKNTLMIKQIGASLQNHPQQNIVLEPKYMLQ